MQLLDSSSILADGHSGLRREILLYLCSHFFPFIVVVGKFINKLVSISLFIATVKHIHISIISIFDGYFIIFICWIVRIVSEYILSWFTFESILNMKYIPRLFTMCCIIFFEYLFIYALLPFDNSLSSCFCCSSSTWSNYFISGDSLFF